MRMQAPLALKETARPEDAVALGRKPGSPHVLSRDRAKHDRLVASSANARL